ncbi:MAG: S53 family peptidase [Acidimicrobiales bacterium]
MRKAARSLKNAATPHRRSSKRRSAAVGTSLCSALIFGGLASVTTASAATTATSGRVAIAGTLPSWATTKKGVEAPAVTKGVVDADIYLAGRDNADLTSFATAVSTPGNPDYHQYLTTAQLKSRFGPTHAQVSEIENWVKQAGMKVTSVNDEIGGYVAASGSVAEASRAFGVTFGMFKFSNGKTYRAPARSASAPANVASAVLTIGGLDTAPHLMRPQEKLPPPGKNYWIARPCATYYGQKTAGNEPSAYGTKQPWNVCGYTQAQIRSAYGVTASGMTGKGQTVAIVDAYASPTMPGDANEFSKVIGDEPFKPGQYKQYKVSPYDHFKACGPKGWYGEETLDIEAVHGQAPDANVHFVAAASCEDSDLSNALAYIVNNHLASIVSDSWGEPQDDATITSVYDLIFRAGAAEGIGFFFSSGDNGYESPTEDSDSNTIQVDYPPADPWVTGVGGTSLAIGQTGNYEFETSWGTLLDPLSSNGKSWKDPLPGKYPKYYDGSSGGGVSSIYTQPFYQRGVVPASLSHALANGTTSTKAMRVVPDVSALADPSTGMLVGETLLQPNGMTYAFSLSRIGGTSVACPTFAGIEADAQQAAGYPLGFANPVIYLRNGSSAFHDVTDHPRGPGYLAEVRNNYTNANLKQGPLVTYLRTLGIDGEGAAALPAVKGYDDATGVGSPDKYIQSFMSS